MNIVKYGNRKMYSPDTKTYVTAPEVYAALVRGETITVKCQKTKRDISEVVLNAVFRRHHFFTTEEVRSLAHARSIST